MALTEPVQLNNIAHQLVFTNTALVTIANGLNFLCAAMRAAGVAAQAEAGAAAARQSLDPSPPAAVDIPGDLDSDDVPVPDDEP